MEMVSFLPRGRPDSNMTIYSATLLYRQQLRVHAWRFWNGKLPPGQAAMLGRVGDVHGHATRSARSGLFLSTRDHRSVGYRIPKEWATVAEVQRQLGSVAAFKRSSRAGFLAGYGGFECRVGGCRVCARGGTGDEGQRGQEV